MIESRFLGSSLNGHSSVHGGWPLRAGADGQKNRFSDWGRLAGEWSYSLMLGCLSNLGLPKEGTFDCCLLVYLMLS